MASSKVHSRELGSLALERSNVGVHGSGALFRIDVDYRMMNFVRNIDYCVLDILRNRVLVFFVVFSL